MISKCFLISLARTETTGQLIFKEDYPDCCPEAIAMGDRRVCVQGISRPDGSALTEEMLQMAFESPRCGGGPVELVEVDATNNVAYIAFKASSSKFSFTN